MSSYLLLCQASQNITQFLVIMQDGITNSRRSKDGLSRRQTSRKIISLDDSDDLNDVTPYAMNPDANTQKSGYKSSNVKLPTLSTNRKDFLKKRSLPFADNPNEGFRELQIIADDQIDQGVNVNNKNEKKTLMFLESMNLYMGHFFNPYTFPIKRQIPIIASVQDEQRQKYETGSYISQAFDNNLKVSFLLFFFRAVFLQHFLRFDNLLWIVAIILAFTIDTAAQYSSNRYLLLALYLTYCIIGILLQYLAIKGRRGWYQDRQFKYKVYNYDHRRGTAQWNACLPEQLRPGNIYKISLSSGQRIPADSILLHSAHSIISVNQSKIVEYLSPLEQQQKVILKQTVVKDEILTLPLTGVIEYELRAPEVRDEYIVGRLTIQEPVQMNLNLSYGNVLVRGTQILHKHDSEYTELVCVVLETGIDSLALKTSQYPYQFRKSYIACKWMDFMVLLSCVLYILVISAGILIGYIYISSTTVSRGYYLEDYLSDDNPTSIGIVTLHHFANNIMVIPILIRVMYLLYILIETNVLQKKIGLLVKDSFMVSECLNAEVLVTTLSADLPRVNREEDRPMDNQDESNDDKKQAKVRSLAAIKIKELYHNFNTAKATSELYQADDIDLIGYFLTVALLTCHYGSNKSPLETAIANRCKTELGLKAEVRNYQNNSIVVGPFKVIEMLTIPATHRHPYKIVFYKYSQQEVEDIEDGEELVLNRKPKLLGLIRGDTSIVMDKIHGNPANYVEYSNRLHQQKGFHVEILGKFLVSEEEFIDISNAYAGKINVSKKKHSINQFYNNLDQLLLRIEAMGLLIWENPYIPNPSKLSISQLRYPQYKIVIAPQSHKQIDPEYHSIHTITNYLLKTFKMPISRLSSKILHQYTTAQSFWQSLKSQKMVVLNGWDHSMIRNMLSEMKVLLQKNQHKTIMGYIQHDEYAWVLKQTDLSIAYEEDGYDLSKYADLVINESVKDTRSLVAIVIKRLQMYAKGINRSLKNIFIIQFSKSVKLATIEFAGFFYSWGTGIAVIGTSFYFLLEVILFLDIFYYLVLHIQQNDLKHWRMQSEALKNSNRDEAQSLWSNQQQITYKGIFIQLLFSILIAIFIFFGSVYAIREPTMSTGTIESRQFVHLLIHFILAHQLILRKLMLSNYQISIFKMLIVVLQISLYYVGLILISEFEILEYRGIIWYFLNGRVLLTGALYIIIIYAVYWFVFMFNGFVIRSSNKKEEPSKLKSEKDSEQEKYQLSSKLSEQISEG